MQALPPQLDPQVGGWIVMQRVYCMIYDTLITRDWANGGETVGLLATSWSYIDDSTLEFTLRDDVVWHDGTPFTATDVKFTFDRSLANDPLISTNGTYPLNEVVAVDAHTVRFLTKGPQGAFFSMLAEGGAYIVPAAYHTEVGYEQFQLKPIGTGPYKVTEYAPDTHIALDVNEQYFGGVSAAKKVMVYGVPEVSTRIAALLNDEYDLILDLPPDQVPTVQNGGDFTITDVAPLNSNIYAIIGTNPWVEKKEIRQALSLGIDRQLIVDELLLGFGVVPTTLQSPLDPLYTERPPLEYNPEKAKELMTAAGYNGEEITLACDSPNYYPLEREWTEVIIGMWQEIGLNVTMGPIDVNERVTLGTDDPWHLFTSSTGLLADTTLYLTYGNPNAAYQRLFAPGQFDELNEVVNEALVTVDVEQRKALYKQAFDILEDFTMVLNLFTINRVSASKPNLTWQETPNFGIELRAGKFTVA